MLLGMMSKARLAQVQPVDPFSSVQKSAAAVLPSAVVCVVPLSAPGVVVGGGAWWLAQYCQYVVWTGHTSYFGFSAVALFCSLFCGRGRWVAFRKARPSSLHRLSSASS